MRLPLALLPAVLVALVATAPAAGAPRDRCHRDGDRTVALDRQVRVYQSGDDGYYYGCLRRTGRTTLLWEQDDLYVAGNVRVLAGRFVAYSVGTSPGCKADCPPDVHGTFVTSVTDVRTGRTRELHDGRVYALLLRATGTVAWVAGPAPDAALSVWSGGGARALLDRGDIHDVRAAGGVLRWKNADLERSAPFA